MLAAGLGIAVPALPLFAKSFHVDFSAAAIILVANQIGATASTLPSGALTDRFGGRKMVLLGPILVGIASLLMASARSFPELLAYRFLEGWGMQMWQIGRLDIITATGGERRGTQITGMFGMDNAGRLMGPALGGFIAAAFGLRAPFLLYGFAAMATIIPSYFLVPDIAGSKSRSGAAAAASDSLRSRLRRTWAGYVSLLTLPLMALLAAQLMASMTRGALFGGTLDLYAVYYYGVGPKVVGLLATAGTALGLPLTFVSGRIMDRFGRRTVVTPGFSLLAVALVFMAMSAFQHWPFAHYVGVFLFTRLSMGTVAGTMQVIGSDVAPPGARGTFFGLWSLMRNIGAFLSPATFAFVAQGFGYGWSFALLSVMSVSTATILGLRLRSAGRPRPAAVAVA